MPTEASRADVVRLVATGAQLVDVLPTAEFAESHLPHALNLPLKRLNRDTVGQLDRDAPIVVYCHDSQ